MSKKKKSYLIKKTKKKNLRMAQEIKRKKD